ncbi:GGDEF domain-containing protein [Alicyclobacillus fastidiosus]|uniref:GGDEF domain-containing protein n=1 Tax=Alicyclobacillus fastidiosus TaxID=392011 RepID=A0ABV5AIM5_9BACL|nr:GGDEF domain-containing protein [Alicyclobacillus fastidiosus]WEH07812.1 GGDEF domain-containing protein [Alicyclobacillus fastidiosus]
MNAELLKKFFYRTREWARASRGLELFQLASEALRDLAEVDSGFFIYRKRVFVNGVTPSKPHAYAAWGVFEHQEEDLASIFASEENLYQTFKGASERWMLAEDIPSSQLQAYLSRYPLLDFGFWPLMSREQMTGALVVARTHAVSGRMTTEMSNALLDSCAAQLSVALDLILTVRIAEESSRRDLLTGTYNRRGVYARLPEMVEEAALQDRQLIIGVIDLDDLKAVNDTLGHPAGDTLIRETSNAIQECVGDEALVSRLGGDEFLIAFYADLAQAMDVMEAIQSSVLQATGGHSVSVGFAVWGVDGDTLDRCYEVADARLYQHKRERKSTLLTE